MVPALQGQEQQVSLAAPQGQVALQATERDGPVNLATPLTLQSLIKGRCNVTGGVCVLLRTLAAEAGKEVSLCQECSPRAPSLLSPQLPALFHSFMA